MTGGSAGEMYDMIVKLKDENILKEHDAKYYIAQALICLDNGNMKMAIRDLTIAIDMIALQ